MKKMNGHKDCTALILYKQLSRNSIHIIDGDCTARLLGKVCRLRLNVVDLNVHLKRTQIRSQFQVTLSAITFTPRYNISLTFNILTFVDDGRSNCFHYRLYVYFLAVKHKKKYGKTFTKFTE